VGATIKLRGLGRGTPRYGIRGDSTSLKTLSYEILTLKTWIKMCFIDLS